MSLKLLRWSLNQISAKHLLILAQEWEELHATIPSNAYFGGLCESFCSSPKGSWTSSCNTALHDKVQRLRKTKQVNRSLSKDTKRILKQGLFNSWPRLRARGHSWAQEVCKIIVGEAICQKELYEAYFCLKGHLERFIIQCTLNHVVEKLYGNVPYYVLYVARVKRTLENEKAFLSPLASEV